MIKFFNYKKIISINFYDRNKNNLLNQDDNFTIN